MESNRYIIKDNFDNELNDFDIVCIPSIKTSDKYIELAIYYKTLVLFLSNFYKKAGDTNRITVKRYQIVSTDKNSMIVDRLAVQNGKLHGTFKIKNIMKISNPTEKELEFRDMLMDNIKRGYVTSNISRKTLNEISKEYDSINMLNVLARK